VCVCVFLPIDGEKEIKGGNADLDSLHWTMRDRELAGKSDC
jgi:hypothetical protein